MRAGGTLVDSSVTGSNDIGRTRRGDGVTNVAGFVNLPTVATLSGFAPWIVYWVLVGNVPFAVAAFVALALAAVSVVVARVSGASGQALEIGSIATFSVVAILTFTLSESLVARWVLSLTIVGILAVAVDCALTRRRFVPEFAAVGPATDVTRSELFGQMSTRVTWIWVAALAGMAVSSAIPPIVLRDATVLNSGDPLSVVCYWVVPLALLSFAALASRTLQDRAVAEVNSPDTVRRTSFVAYHELAIDELYYLAQQRADREVGAGMEAYSVKVGGAGVPLTGDESRMSWPATYKVRERR